MKQVKIFLYITFLLVLINNSAVHSQQYWQKISTPTAADLRKCAFVDTLNGWAAGDSGKILRTTNGGYNWILQDSKVRSRIEVLYFFNTRIGWAVTWGNGPEFYGSIILKTTNGGNVWDTSAFFTPSTYIRTVYFQDSLYGFMGGNPMALFRTTNGGNSWDRCATDSVPVAGFPINKFRFFTQNYGIACGGIMDIAGVIWTTTNRGLYWTAKPITSEPINDVRFFDSLNIIAIAGDYEYGTALLRTSNGGLNWEYNNIGVFGIPQTMSFRTNTEAWCPLGYLPNMLQTSNSGYNWSMVDTPDSTKLFDLTFLNNRFGIAVGLNGDVIKYNPAVTFTVSGIVRYNDNNQLVTAGKVKAFKINKSNYKVVYLDSASIQSDGTYTLSHVPQDSVQIGVFPNPAPPNDFVITYYPSTINWQSAAVIYPAANMNNININVFRLVSTVANNSVNGKVMQGAKTPLSGLKDVFVYVKSGNNFVRCGITDSIGVYHMLSLPSGNLKVIVNRLGYYGDSATVNMTPTTNLDSINFILNRVSVGIIPVVNIIPSEFQLYQNYPNPFNPKTNIRYSIPSIVNRSTTADTKNVESSVIRLIVYDIQGREITTLVNEKQSPGIYEVQFPNNSITSNQLPSGVYFYSLYSDGERVASKKMLMIK